MLDRDHFRYPTVHIDTSHSLAVRIAGAVIGGVIGGPVGAVLGWTASSALKDRDDAAGEIARDAGRTTEKILEKAQKVGVRYRPMYGLLALSRLSCWVCAV